MQTQFFCTPLTSMRYTFVHHVRDRVHNVSSLNNWMSSISIFLKRPFEEYNACFDGNNYE